MPDVATYRALFRTPEFGPLFLTVSLQVTAGAVGVLALGTLVFARTASPLLAALAMFGPAFAQVIGATMLLSAADRLPPRPTLAGLALISAGCTAAQAIPGLPVWGIFAVLLPMGAVTSVGGGVRYGLLSEIVTTDGYVLGRSVLNMSVGATQICGYAIGGLLVAGLSPRGTLLIAAALDLAAMMAALGLTRRPARATGRPSIARTWRTNVLLWSSVPRRYVYLALWVPNGLIAGCESLFVSYDPRHAGLLLASAAVGMLAGDTVTGRFLPPEWRARLGSWLRLLLAAPFLVFALRPPLPLAVAAVTLAAVGYAASLLLQEFQERLMALTSDELRGHALGLHSSGMLTLQGLCAALAGSIAEYTSPAIAMTLLAVASVTVTLALAPGLRPAPRPVAAGHDDAF
jgi:predicted MFS family arabinose efflux permease